MKNRFSKNVFTFGLFGCSYLYLLFQLGFAIPKQIQEETAFIYFRGVDLPFGISLVLILLPFPWQSLNRVLKFLIIGGTCLLFFTFCEPLNEAYLEAIKISEKYRFCDSIRRKRGKVQVWGRRDLPCSQQSER